MLRRTELTYDEDRDYESEYEKYLQERSQKERANKLLHDIKYMSAVEEGFLIFDEIPAASDFFISPVCLHGKRDQQNIIH